MIPRVAAVSAAAVLIAAAPVGARGADAGAPLRSLTYAVDVALVDRVDAPSSTLSSGARAGIVVKGRVVGGGPGGATGSGDVRSSAARAAKGSITVDVLQATADAGLVIAIAETTNAFTRAKVRIGIASDGTLLYDPADGVNLSEEELLVAHWLGRGFYGDRPKDVGTSWVVDLSANGRVDVERYRVLARDAHQVTLAYSFEEHSNKATGFAGTREGSLVYDTTLVVPVQAAYETLAHRQLGSSYDTVRTAVKLTLTADSFAGRD